MKRIVSLVTVALLGLLSAGVLFAGGAKEEAQELIVYHWWTAGGEKEAIDAVFEVFAKKHPEIRIVENPVSGGGGGVMRGQIKTMVMAGQSPDTFQLTYGTGMLGSFAEVLQPIDELWEGLPFPPLIKQMGNVNGHQVAIPLNMMRCNTLWYNKKLVDKLGIRMPLRTYEEFSAACEKAKNAGYVAFAVGAGSGQQFWWAHIAEQIIVGVPSGGPAYLEKLYTGRADPARDPAVRETLEIIAALFDRGFVNSDYSALTWDQASDLLMTEEAVFYQMGDWAKGHFTSAGWKPKVDFDYQPSPGTEGSFTLNLDGFSLCKGAPHKDAVIKWLTVVSSVEAETAFCPIKGATPPRLDAPIDMYDDISKDILKAFRDPATKVVQSCFSGPPESWLDVYGGMISKFAEHRNVAQGVREFAEAYRKVFPK
ncbi:MAG: carbohydrate ABC transporter substrate-binding protein [Spirochaetales bacterium]|nr:carbohydrate ABC transporter substrate-binding protein [Spirochaetales bacterium]